MRSGAELEERRRASFGAMGRKAPQVGPDTAGFGLEAGAQRLAPIDGRSGPVSQVCGNRGGDRRFDERRYGFGPITRGLSLGGIEPGFEILEDPLPGVHGHEPLATMPAASTHVSRKGAMSSRHATTRGADFSTFAATSWS